MEAKLIVVGGDAKAGEISLKLPTIIGRGRGASLTLPHPLVSRQHCEIFESDGHLVVRDLGSLNGTFVNNQKVTEAVLPPGELLTIGTVTFRAAYQSDGEAAPAAVAQPVVDPQAGTVTAPSALATATSNEPEFQAVAVPQDEPVEADELPMVDDEDLAEILTDEDAVADLEDSDSDLLAEAVEDSSDQMETQPAPDTVQPAPSPTPENNAGPTIGPPPGADAGNSDDDELNSFLQGLP